MPREAAEFTDYSDEDAGIILKPGKNDVLFGRGGAINSHEGNITFRNVVNDQKDDYFKASKTEKPKIAIKVVSIIKSLSPPGRFLAPVRDSDKNCTKSCSIWWYDVGFKKARAKASQCLRERERLEYKVKKQKETAQAEIQGFEPNTSAHSASPQKCSNHFSVDLPDPSLSQQNSKIILPPNSRKTREVEYDGIQEEAKSAKKLKTIEKKSVDPNTFARPTSLYYSNHHSPIDIPDSFTHRNVRIDLSPITHGRDNFAVISNDDYETVESLCNRQEPDKISSHNSWIGSFCSVESHLIDTSMSFSSQDVCHGKDADAFRSDLKSSSSTVSDITYQSEQEFY